jgi:hypothetical protein
VGATTCDAPGRVSVVTLSVSDALAAPALQRFFWSHVRLHRHSQTTAVSSELGIFRGLYDLQLYDEWSGSKFPPKEAAVYLLIIIIIPSFTDIKSDVRFEYFCTLEKIFVLKSQYF